MILLIVSLVALAAISVAVFFELRRDLMMLQQNSYRRERYMNWLRKSGDTTSTAHIIGYILLFIGLCGFSVEIFSVSGICLFGIIRTWQLVAKKYKKPLVMTRRAMRIFVCDIILFILITGAAVALFGLGSDMQAAYAACMGAMGVFCCAHIVTLLSDLILSPVERHINRKFYNRAAGRLASMPGLRIIGITGSYGKTSTKHYLHRILSEHFDTLMTPGSYNTTLGVVRTINEYLKPYNEVFIVEMGAKQTGDIKEICDLVHPSIGIITAVGPQHLESFKTIENVRETKFELADALPADGIAVINNDFEQSRKRNVSGKHALRYGISAPKGCDYTAKDIRYSPDGSEFTVTGTDGTLMTLTTSLVGECNISNLIAAVIVALKLGVPAEKIKYAVSTIRQVEHRLSMRRLPGGITIIDDAFNSNPSGSKMALDVLAMMPAGQRIIITPGMIELGDMQHELNREFGKQISRSADYAFIVGQYNRDAIMEGLTDGMIPDDHIFLFDTFLQANAHAMSIARPGATILIENDLPDTFK
ncbi:MAG: UDP-N-acetylmuramoyl-tripeptide--D-alanyl-D-alanine ligase [Bacteroidales bacterium]|nr:UDP-N-acetylmuramoyl-tripeptide--D-alanyl-D-alanine ligase [Bacteroidales bacterium]